MDRLKMHTQDIVDVNVGKIGKLFPNCLTERVGENGRLEHAIDFDKLRVVSRGPRRGISSHGRGSVRLCGSPTLRAI